MPIPHLTWAKMACARGASGELRSAYRFGVFGLHVFSGVAFWLSSASRVGQSRKALQVSHDYS